MSLFKMDRSELERLYLVEKKSAKQVAEVLGCHSDTVNSWLRRFGIPVRSRTEAASLRCSGRVSPMKGRKLSPEQRQRKVDLWKDPAYRQHMVEAHKGERSSLWRGGVSKGDNLYLARSEWRNRAKECYIRDSGRCQDCGVKCLSWAESRQKKKPHLKIQAHHIIRRRDGGTDDLSNLVTLCASCHMRRDLRFADALFA